MTAVHIGVDPAEIAEFYRADSRPAAPHRPWTIVGMLSSIDGGATVDGDSSDLGQTADRAVFRALRSVADVILVGASTIRAEGYGVPLLSAETRVWRESEGKTSHPRVAVITRGLDLPLDTELFERSNPLVFTVRSADADRRTRVAARAEVIEAGDEDVQMDLVLSDLRARGLGVALIEGGPSINGQIFEVGAVDELCLTLTCEVVSGEGPRIVAGSSLRHPLELDRVIVSEGELLLRYLTAKARA